MNALMNITVRVQAGQALAQIKAVQGATKGLVNTGSSAGTKNFLGGLAEGNLKLEKFGKNLQWTGRQLLYNFTIPIGLAGAAAFKFAMDNEKAFTGVTKVYGDFSFSQKRVRQETDILRKSFELLSSRYGVLQKDVIDIGAAWASAGASGRSLQEATRSSLELMILGEMEATEATQALISITATWRFSMKKNKDGVSELSSVLSDLNAVENQTAIRFADLIMVTQRAGAVARISGMDFQHLAAMAAALVPSTGGAAQAGNALRTIISRLQSPTKDMVDILGKMGIDVMSPEWMGKTVTDKIETVARTFEDLTSAQQAQAASVLGSRWQVSKFSQLMLDINSKTGNYAKALDAMNDKTRTQALYSKELQTVLDSNPKKFEILTNSMKNMLASAIIPILPAIMNIVGAFTGLLQKFADMDPASQRQILMWLAILALAGPVIQYLGATTLLVSQIGKVGIHAAQGIAWLTGQLFKMGGKVLSFFADVVLGALWTVAGWIDSVWVAIFGGQTAAATTAAATTTTANTTAAGGATTAWLTAYGTIGSGGGVTAEMQAAAAQAAAAAEATAAGEASAAWLASYASIAGGAGTTAAAQGVAAEAAGAATATGAGAGFLGAITGFFGMIGTALVSLGGYVLTGLAGLVSVVAVTLGIPIEAAIAVIVAAVVAVIATVLYIFNKDFRHGVNDVMKSIASSVWSAVRVIANAFVWLLQAIVKIMETIWEALSRLNPFQRHSPSLVDNVKAGVAVILSEFARLRAIPSLMSSADAALQNFGKATAGAANNFENMERADTRKTIVSAAPNAGPAVDAMFANIDRLKAALVPVQAAIDQQSRVVNRWEAAVAKADRTLKVENHTLSELQFRLNSVGRELDKAKNLITEYSSMGITGMRAMDDAIFSNEMAQKRLRLEMLRMEEVVGPLDNIQDRMSALQGQIETLRAEQSSLRDAGAGSDILSFYDDQISALEAQQNGLTDSANQLDEINKQLEDLQRQGEILNLEKSINFDPQLRQIQQLAEGLHELPFDQIMAKISEQQAEVTRLQPAYDAINAKVEKQQALVDQLQYARDNLAYQLDIEKEKLDTLNSIYSDINDQIQEMESAMQNFASSAEAAARALEAAKGKDESLANQLFDAGAAGGNFEIPGGTAELNPDAMDLGSMEDFNKEIQAELDKAMKGMGDFDIFKPIKDAWNRVWGNIKNWAGNVWHPIHFLLVRPIEATAGWIGRNFSLTGVKNAWNTATSAMGSAWNVFSGVISSAWNTYIYPALAAIGNFLWSILGPAFSFIGAVASAVWGAITAAVSTAWGFIQPILQGLYDFFMGYIFPIFQLFGAIVNIVLTLVGRLFKWAWDEMIYPVIKWLLENLWKVIPGALAILWIAMQTAWKAITGVISWAWNNVIKPIFDLINWVLKNVIGPVFKWLYDNIIKPVWDAIGKAISWAWTNVIKPAWDAIGKAISTMATEFVWLRDNIIKPVWNGIASIISGTINTITGALETGINAFIKGFNFLARGVKAVGSALSISVSINEMDEISIPKVKIPKMATGGQVPTAEVGSGFRTSGARAIVGEGNPSHPEYVIPTDPRYRNRAIGLARNLLMDLFGGRGKLDAIAGQTHFAIGGILPSPGDIVKTVGDGLSSLKDGAVSLAWKPFKALAEEAIKKISLKVPRDVANWGLGKVDSWVTDSDKNLNEALAASIEALVGNIKHKPGVNMNLNKDFLRRYAAYNKELGNPFTVVSGLRTYAQQVALYQAYLNGTGNLAAKPGTSNHESGYALDHSPGTQGKAKRFMDIAAKHGLKYPVPGEDWHVEPIVRIPDSIVGGQHPPPLALGGTIPIISAELGSGGRIPAIPGGTLIKVAEAGRPEEVQVLPLNGDNADGRGERHLHFHGANFNFPNVKTAEDAEDFLDNLERLASV